LEQLDYIVVGLGIAGLTFCEQLLQHKKRFIVIDTPNYNASAIAGGVCHPMVLKRFTLAWNASNFLTHARPFYKTLEERLNISFVEDIPVKRIFSNAEEQNDWAVASDKNAIGPHLYGKVEQNSITGVIAPYGFGRVRGSFKLNTPKLLQNYREWLVKNNAMSTHSFDFENLSISAEGINYQDIHAKHIVFAEGALARNNPFFPHQALIGKKGEYIIVHCPDLELHEILKGKCFIIPLGDDRYKVGATFAHEDHSNQISEAGKEELIEAFKKIVTLPFEVVDHMAGVRPTVKDRRPLIGDHDAKMNIHFLNGLGTRGIMMAPTLSKWLLEHIETGETIPSEVNIQRFYKK